ncbi:hypothetical protein, partial [Porphyromonas levii]|uniref:hypothetical protein n=1 Tax=Porphyromonas levii TaxID=28114 RepID=UPI001B7FD2EF
AKHLPKYSKEHPKVPPNTTPNSADLYFAESRFLGIKIIIPRDKYFYLYRKINLFLGTNLGVRACYNGGSPESFLVPTIFSF